MASSKITARALTSTSSFPSGYVDVPSEVREQAAVLGRAMYEQAEAAEFSGDAVETLSVPVWALNGGAVWLPAAPAGWRYRDDASKGELVMTAGVDAHTDDEGLVLMLTLHNEGMTFVQGRTRIVPQAGDWFVFDDRRAHGMKEARSETMFVGWHRRLIAD